MYYMLNLVFNYTDTTASNGRFVDYDAAQTNPLLTSKAWLQPVSTAPTPPDPNNSAHWQFFERDKQHLNFALADQATLWVRVVDSNQATDNYNSRITILMGRNDQKAAPQSMSSPVQNANGVTGPLCIWDVGFGPATTTNGGTVASWFVPLGAATTGTPHMNNLYLFIVAATVQGNPERTFSHDPDMDVSC